VILREKNGAIERLGYVRCEFAKTVAADIGEIAVPPLVIDADVPLALAGAHGQADQSSEDSVAHERADAHRSVIGASHRVTDPRVDSPHAELLRNSYTALKLRGLTQKRHQTVGLAADRRHLIHHAARCTHDQVFDLLAAHRARARIDRQLPRSNHCFHGCRFNRRRRADALAFGNVRLDEDRRATGELHAVLTREHVKHARDVAGPVIGSVSGEPRPDRVVRAISISDHVERDLAAALVSVMPHRNDRNPGFDPGTNSDACRLSNRPLQHEGTGIVRDPAHDVETSGRTCDEHWTHALTRTLTPHASVYPRGHVSSEPRQVRDGFGNMRRRVKYGLHTINPRRTSARCNCGSTCARTAWLA
jgi:hypothetical protein